MNLETYIYRERETGGNTRQRTDTELGGSCTGNGLRIDVVWQ